DGPRLGWFLWTDPRIEEPRPPPKDRGSSSPFGQISGVTRCRLRGASGVEPQDAGALRARTLLIEADAAGISQGPRDDLSASAITVRTAGQSDIVGWGVLHALDIELTASMNDERLVLVVIAGCWFDEGSRRRDDAALRPAGATRILANEK